MNTHALNPAQQEAVNHIDGPLLVLAGAGSGKTRIVTARISRLISLGVPPSSIIAVTFTNKAAGEMRERIKQSSSHTILATTFHSLCVRILREQITVLGFPADFAIYDEDDTEKIVKECLKQKELEADAKIVKNLRSAISQKKNELLFPEDLKADEEPLLRTIYPLYQKKLKECGAIDFDDMLLLTVKLLDTHPEILRIYQNRWRYLCVDEFQDTNEAQYQLCKLLAKEHHNLFVVGDPDQSIYSWRGANIDNILHFEADYPGTKVVALEQNYRSTSTILSAANALIGQNPSRYKKRLWSDLGEGEKISLVRVNSEREEAEFVAKNIAKLKREGIPLDQCAIFYRTNFQSRPFEDLLLRYRIPYVIIGGLSFYQRKEIKDILSYLKLAINPADFLSFARTINIPKRGIGAATIDRIAALSTELGVGILTATKLAASGQVECKLSPRQREGLRAYLLLIQEIQDRLHDPISKTLDRIIALTNYKAYLEEDTETAQEKKENLQELIAKAVEWEKATAAPLVKQFLEEIALHSQAQSSPDTECVRLMTLHNGKGLEFDAVFLVGMEEELFPHINSYGSEEAIQEERRLAYVGMTRAKKRLFLTCALFRFLWGAQKTMRPSRFLREIPDKYIEGKAVEPEEAEIEEGREVYHREFGKGIITRQYNSSLGLTYDVYFPSQKITRSLISRFANLTML